MIPPRFHPILDAEIAISGPIHGHFARFHHNMLIPSCKVHQVHQQLDIVLAVFANLFLAAVTPPLNDFQAISCLLISQRFTRQVVELYAEAKTPLQIG
jgi:hypothetical protein